MKKLLFICALIFPFTFATFSQGCLPQGISFTTQEQIDSFQVNYPGCTRILGNVSIGDPNGTDIENLAGLNVITSIGGTLSIGGNHSLLNLTGLENLDSIGQNLYLYVVESTPYSVTHVGNYAMESMTGLEGLVYIGGNLGIENNSQLAYCEMEWICDYLANPNGIVNISGNSPGCNSVVELAGFCGDSLPCLPMGNYFLSTQEDIDRFMTAFPNCTEPEGDVTIDGLDQIVNLDGLSALTYISGDLALWGCTALPKLSAFENLTSIGEDLMIEYNNFESLAGLENLTSIGGGIIILGNENITSLSGLDNIEGGSITSLLIWDNINLSACDVASICDYLAVPGNPNYIMDNSPGCNHKQEILDACEVGVEEFAVGSSQLAIGIQPNPAATTITVSLPPEIPVIHASLAIYNANGRPVMSQQITESQTSIEISSLSPGLYFVRIIDNNQVGAGKFVKK